MANETIGEIECKFCGSMADIRKSTKGKKKLYLMCPLDGQNFMRTERGQDYILDNGKFFSPADKVQQIEEPEVIAKPEPVKKKSFFENLLSDD